MNAHSEQLVIKVKAPGEQVGVGGWLGVVLMGTSAAAENRAGPSSSSTHSFPVNTAEQKAGMNTRVPVGFYDDIYEESASTIKKEIHNTEKILMMQKRAAGLSPG